MNYVFLLQPIGSIIIMVGGFMFLYAQNNIIYKYKSMRNNVLLLIAGFIEIIFGFFLCVLPMIKY
jgi:uncharacterized membrane protein